VRVFFSLVSAAEETVGGSVCHYEEVVALDRTKASSASAVVIASAVAAIYAVAAYAAVMALA
jgi:hypothetical protein